MLRKLFKWEFAATARYFLPAYLIVVVIAVFTRAVNALLQTVHSNILYSALQIPNVLISFLYLISMTALTVFTVIIAVYRFYKTLIGTQGYLLNTLPVKPWQHIFVKTVTSFVWCILSIITLGISVMTISANIRTFRIISEELITSFGASSVLTGFEMTFALVCWIFASLLGADAAISVGQLFTGHKILGSILAYIGFGIVSQIIAFLFALCMEAAGGLDMFEMILTDFHISSWAIIISNIIPAAVYFLITNYMLKNKLNLE